MSGAAGFRASNAVHLRKEGGHVLLLEARADHLANIKSDEGHRPEVALDGIRRKIHNYFHQQRKDDGSSAKIEQKNETSQTEFAP